MKRHIVHGLAVLLGILTPVCALAENVAAEETTITGGTLVVAAYLVLWALLLIYLVVLSARQQRLDEEIDDLERRLDTLLGIEE